MFEIEWNGVVYKVYHVRMDDNRDTFFYIFKSGTWLYVNANLCIPV